MNKNQIPLINYNLQDGEAIVDSLGGYLTTVDYFKCDVMQHAFEKINLEERLDEVHKLMAKFIVFT